MLGNSQHNIRGISSQIFKPGKLYLKTALPKNERLCQGWFIILKFETFKDRNTLT